MAVNNLKKRLRFGCVFISDTRCPTSVYLEVIFFIKANEKNHYILFYNDTMFVANFSTNNRNNVKLQN